MIEPTLTLENTSPQKYATTSKVKLIFFIYSKQSLMFTLSKPTKLNLLSSKVEGQTLPNFHRIRLMCSSAKAGLFFGIFSLVTYNPEDIIYKTLDSQID